MSKGRGITQLKFMLTHRVPALTPDTLYDQMHEALQDEQAALHEHRVFGLVDSPQAIRVFMASHIFAVWDFMSLTKALQAHLTCTTVPWLPPTNADTARFINEIVLGEETDEVAPGVFMSHYELYLAAMRDVGADTAPAQRLVGHIRQGMSEREALDSVDMLSTTRDFVLSTLHWARARVHVLASVFVMSREDVIPNMFRRLLAQNVVSPKVPAGTPRIQDTSNFELYLERHVELDEESHGPMAKRMLQQLCGVDTVAWKEAEEAARSAIASRHRLWDGIAEQLERLPR